MKKTVRNTIILLVLLVVLGGAAFLLMNMPESGGEDVDSSSSQVSEGEETVKIIDKEPKDVKSMKVENAEDSFNLVPMDDDYEEPRFTIEGYDDYELNNSQISSNVRSLLGTKAIKDLGSRDDLDAFGLGSDAGKVTIEYKDGDTDTILLGNKAAESLGNYILKDGTVYVASSLPTYFYGSKFAYFYTSVYEVDDRIEVTIDDDGNETQNTVDDILRTITFSGKRFPDPVTVEYTSRVASLYAIREPIVAESGNTAFIEMVSSLKSLSADSVVAAGLTDEVLEKYGLAEPEAQIEFNLNDSKHKLAVSAKDNEGNRFLMADDNDLVYKVSNDLVEKWADTELLKLRMSYIWLPNINDVSNLTVTLDGDEVHEFNIERSVNEEKSTDKNTVYILTVTDAGGNQINYDDGYQPFYKNLLSLAVFSEEQADFSGTPDVKIVYSYFDGGSDTVELYKMSELNRYIAVLNGQFNGQVRATEVNAMLESMPNS